MWIRSGGSASKFYTKVWEIYEQWKGEGRENAHVNKYSKRTAIELPLYLEEVTCRICAFVGTVGFKFEYLSEVLFLYAVNGTQGLAIRCWFQTSHFSSFCKRAVFSDNYYNNASLCNIRLGK